MQALTDEHDRLRNTGVTRFNCNVLISIITCCLTAFCSFHLHSCSTFQNLTNMMYNRDIVVFESKLFDFQCSVKTATEIYKIC